mgnify:CR=1 FL=1
MEIANMTRLSDYDTSRTSEAMVKESHRITSKDVPEVRSILLSVAHPEFTYREGQNIGITVPGAQAFGKEQHFRLYTIANSPRQAENGEVEIELTLTSPMCPLGPEIMAATKSAAEDLARAMRDKGHGDVSAVRLASAHAACDVLELEAFNEDDLYRNLDWLAEQQVRIEDRLFRHRYSQGIPELFLYDVTSSYLEGVCNALAAFGYNRDGKSGKRQIVYGLLCDPQGVPVSIEAFPGNTTDSKTFGSGDAELAGAAEELGLPIPPGALDGLV